MSDLSPEEAAEFERKRIVSAFCDECQWARSIRIHFAGIYEHDSRPKLLEEVAAVFFSDLNIILKHFIVLQICKLTDPKGGSSKSNLTTEYLLHLEWNPETKKVLEQSIAILRKFREKIVPARSKLVAHTDVTARLNTEGMGSFTKEEEDEFWQALQQFVTASHTEVFGDDFEIEVPMMGNAYELVHYLKLGIDLRDAYDERPDLVFLPSRYPDL